MLSWYLIGWSLCFVIRGLRTDSHSNTSRERGFIMKFLVAWDGQPSRRRQVHLLPLLPPGLIHVSAGSMHELWFPPPSKRGPWCGLITVSTEFHFSQGILAILMSSALCVLQFSLLTTSLLWFSLYISWEGNFTDSADLFLARLLTALTGWPCIRWPHLWPRDLEDYLNGTSSTPILNLLYS